MVGRLDVFRTSENIVSFTFMGLCVLGGVRLVLRIQCMGDRLGIGAWGHERRS